MSIGDFLADQSLGSWADEMDNAPLPSPSFGARREGAGGSSAGTWGSSGFAARGGGAGGESGGDFSGSSRLGGYAVREALPMPSKPPYTAHLGNLSFEVTDGDVQDFLSGCEVTSVRIVEDKMDRRPKGFGYVEFATLDGLKKALELSDTQFQGRNIRISVADPPKEREGQRDISDWTRKGPLPDLPGQGGSMRRAPGSLSERGGSFRGGFEGGAGEEGGDRRKPSFFEGDGKVRDFGNWERKGPLSPVERPAGGSMRGRGTDAPRERRQSPAWGEGTGRGSEAGSRPPRREFQERPVVEKAPTAADMDNQWRTKMKPDAPSPSATPEVSTPTSPVAPAAPATRPRLNLAKRTVSEAQPQADAAGSDAKASPFGAARPIDTSTREKEIEEKRQLAIRQKKEQDDKKREEKRAKDAAAKEEKVSTPASEKPEVDTHAQENGQTEAKEPAAPGRQYEILRRMGADEEADGDAVDASANGEIIGDKATLPQEPVVVKGGDSWRKKSADAAAAATTTAEGMEDDGWSTVSVKQKNFSRRGGSRAMAS
ncbi:hypothetical protein MBLNU459_g4712t2 [Dothideomycetes sp. NU459]